MKNITGSVILSPSAVHYPTSLFNAFLFRPNTPPPSVTSSLKFADCSIAIAVPPLWNELLPALRQISDPSHELTKPHPLLSLHSSFTPNLKHCSSTNPFMICPLLPTSLPVSTPNTNYTIQHSRLTCLTLWI